MYTEYPHMPIGTVWIYHLLFVCLCVCVCVRLRIFLPRIKLAVSNFARRFIVIQGRESPIFVNFAPPETKVGRICERATTSATFTTIILWLPNTWSRSMWT